ncbi:dTDP-L-rhamnose 4-epimerase [Allocatelliglobosispora scoriae]|uniref:UDP-glucose 4-epimerase n=1 Tax=Allocatelliglobosispora scoriae TaxID=643052 RepID=A0A841BZU2_9ACTN|nr:NAD-dependent epimerase/dehydratase family protein [Allocatelliglobosispora scoriae]MBB5873018.1 dTDP-L-rhamnose 4-epimerase [Allocatelliglobosispora scoriae]
MRILVTGGLGFIGSHVTEALVADGHDVAILDSVHPYAHREQPPTPDGAVLRLGDIRDPDILDELLPGVDAVVHQAAMVGMGVDMADLPEYVGCNDLGTAVLLAAMTRHRVGSLVLASSMVVYGEGAYACPVDGPLAPAPRDTADLAAGRFEPRCPRCGEFLVPGLVDEDARLDPRSVYAATKLAQEHLASAWAHAVGGAAVALRYHNVYGPRMPRDTPYSGVAAIFRSALERGDAPQVFEDGGQRRDFVHVRDVAAANVAALAAATGSMTGLRAYNVASGHVTTVGEMAGSLAEVMAGPPPIVTGRFRAGDVRHVVASPARARHELGFAARIDFRAGLTEFAAAGLRS